ncbi:MAG: hypothetical protein Ct9H90mP28_1250 [Paracoccaceae bacterium]|nr:MAG: hypothetical protein Ct9H90mP28_1250 [Paracoccaceae bacterium]
MSVQRHLSTYLNKTRCILTEMLEYRGYDISNISPFTTFTGTDKLDKLSINLSKNGKELIQVHYEVESTRTNHKKLTKRIEDIISKLDSPEKSKDLTIIFLVRDGMTPSVKEAIRLLSEKYGVFIQIFPIRNLMYNCTKHKSVPQHIRITKTEYEVYLQDFLDSLHIESLENLPKIFDTDPVAMFIGLRPGEMCKIIRPSMSAGEHIVYRYCVSAN